MAGSARESTGGKHQHEAVGGHSGIGDGKAVGDDADFAEQTAGPERGDGGGPIVAVVDDVDLAVDHQKNPGARIALGDDFGARFDVSGFEQVE